MRIAFMILLVLVSGFFAQADEPQSKGLKKYESELVVLQKQGLAAYKRLEEAFRKASVSSKVKTMRFLREDLSAALESKDLGKSVAIKALIEKVESEAPCDLLDFKEGQVAVNRIQLVYEKEAEKLKAKALVLLQDEFNAAMESKDLNKALKLKQLQEEFVGTTVSRLIELAKAQPVPEKSAKQEQVKSEQSTRNRITPDKRKTHQGHQYYLVTEPANLIVARKYAESQGGYLARINSPEEQQFLESMVTEDAWIDGNDISEDNAFFFSDGSPVIKAVIRWHANSGFSICGENLLLCKDEGVKVDEGFGKPLHFIIEWD